MEKTFFLKNLKKTWKYAKNSKKHLIIFAIASVIEACLNVILPLMGAKVILNISNGLIEQLILSAVIIFILEIIFHFLSFLKSYLYESIYQKTIVGLQIAIAKETLKLETKEIDKASSGVFIDRLNKDTQDIASIFMEYTFWVSNVISKVGILIAIFIQNKYLFVYSIIFALIIFIINHKRLSVQTKIQKKLKKMQEQKTSLVGELVRGIRDIKVLNASDNILNQTSNKIIESSNEEIHLLKSKNIYRTFESIIYSISDIVFILLGCYLYKKGLLSIPTFVIVYNYTPKIASLLKGVVQLWEYNKSFSIAASRIFEIIDEEKFEKEQFGDKEVSKLNGSIKFKNVNFAYDENKPIIKNLNFEIKPNEKVAFVGKSGAGKSTIFSLITRLYHINSGEIFLDNYNIDELNCSSIRDNMSIITQNPYIFNFSIKDNLLLAKADATMDEIREACKLACIDDFIISLPLGYDTIVGENGIILSGGQKQRIAIARALLMKTEIILFDEATSALDNETQSKIQEAINNLTGEYTILIVAHRLSTVIDCDRIFVIDDGQIIAEGSHKQLLKKCSFYKHLYEKDLQL